MSESEFDPFAEGGPLEGAVHLCQELGVRMPPIPTVFLSLLRRGGPTVFTSRVDLDTLQVGDALIEDAVAGRAAPYVALSHEGHGSNSWHLRYIVVLPEVALFLELPLGGVYMDAEACRNTIDDALAEAEELLAAATQVGSDAQLVIDHRGPAGSRWRVSGDGEWMDERNAITAATARFR